jgi:hypothetical protein
LIGRNGRANVSGRHDWDGPFPARVLSIESTWSICHPTGLV